MSLNACAALVERSDRTRFLATMAAPLADRARLWPLYAYNVEIARAPYASPEPLVAEMRLQWWVDLVEGSAHASRSPKGEIGDAVTDLLEKAPIPPGLLVGMADARRWEVGREPFADRAHFDDFIDATAGNLMWAAGLALGAPTAAEPVIRDFAWGAGLAQWLIAVPELLARGRCPLPDDRPQAVGDLAEEGLARIRRARSYRHFVPRAAIPALWTGWRARAVLKQAAQEPVRVAAGTLGTAEFTGKSALILRAATGYW